MHVRQVVLVLSVTALVLVLEKVAMTQPSFGDERLDVDRRTIDSVAASYRIKLPGYWADSIVRPAINGCEHPNRFHRRLRMLTRLIQRKKAVAADAIEYEYEYRDAEYEYEMPFRVHSLP